MNRWGRPFLESTRGKVVQLLRRDRSSVRDLAEELDLTNNAVRSHLSSLERDGLVRTAGKRAGVRKPETLYALTADADRLFPDAYRLLFARLLERIEVRLPEREVEEMLQEMGEMLAVELVDRPRNSLRERAQQSLDVLESMGGLAELHENEDAYLIQGFSCPLSATVSEHPEVCKLAQALLGEILQAPVAEICDRSDPPKCAFRITKLDQPPGTHPNS